MLQYDNPPSPLATYTVTGTGKLRGQLREEFLLRNSMQLR